MGQEKRKTSSAEEEATENVHKAPRLDAADASETLPELSHPPPTAEVEATTGDSTFNIRSCEHLFNDRDELDKIAHGLKAAHKPPTCEHDSCSGAAGMMACTECSYTYCIGEKGDMENPQGHALWHASTNQHWVALWCDEPSKGYCFKCGLTLMLGQNKLNEDDYALAPRNKTDEPVLYSEDDWDRLFRSVNVDWERVQSNAMDYWRMVATRRLPPPSSGIHSLPSLVAAAPSPLPRRLLAAGVMGQEKRKTSSAEEEATENPHKAPRLEAADASETLPELNHPPSTEEVEAITGDSTFNIGTCKHLFNDREELAKIVRDLKAAHKPPTCEHDPCSGAAGMMACTECSYIYCIGEKENPQGHALWHASTNQHWVALWCDEPSKGYCFKCGLTLMLGQNKVNEDEYALTPRNKKDEPVLYSEDDWDRLFRSVNVDWERVQSNAMDYWRMVASNAWDQWGMVAGDDRVIRGIPNLGAVTCCMNPLLQCLLALGKLRTMILSPDAPLGDIGMHLKQLFVETSSGNNATHMLGPKMILQDMSSLYPKLFNTKELGDSHEFLASLWEALDNDVGQGDALFPTLGSSIFRCELLEIISCKSCSHNEVRHHSVHGLQLSVPSKDSPARSKPLQVDSTEAKDIVHGRLHTEKSHVPTGTVEAPIKASSFIPKLLDDVEGMEEPAADSHITEDKEKSQSSGIVHDLSEHMNSPASIEDCLTLFSHDLTNCKNCSMVAADLPETNGSKNVEPIMASTNLNTTVDGDQTELPDRKTSPSEGSSGLSSLSVESPSRQHYRSDSHHQVILSEDITSEEVNSGKSCGEKDFTLTDGNGGATKTQFISKLPPVLTIQLQRYSPDLSLLSGRVSYKEILHVGPFMDPSSEDKDNLSYRLVGVIEHIAIDVNIGHYNAYVRASRGQQGSGPSSWVCASDAIIRRVSLDDVLRSEASILFYERIYD